MKRVHAAVIGAVIIAACAALGWKATETRTYAPDAGAPVYAYVDLEHVVMSHPRYGEYHRLELEYNAMIAQYQFEQQHYSRQAAAEGLMMKQFAAVDAVGTAAFNEELKAKLVLKERELNNGLQQQYERIVKERRKTQPIISNADNLRIVNLQLKLQNVALRKEERDAAVSELHTLLKNAGTGVVVTGDDAGGIEAAMAPYREEARQELEQYGRELKEEMEKRRNAGRSAFQSQMERLRDRPDPDKWNLEWKERLAQKEKDISAVRDAIMADIREKAGLAAQEQGIDMVFCEYAGIGTALDITDDIIARLA